MSLAIKKELPSKLTDLTLTELTAGLRAKKFSATEVAKTFIDAVERARPLNAFVTETPELALQQSQASDARLAKGEVRALEAVPIANKDLFCTKGVRTTASSKMLEKFVPPYESTVTQQLLDAGVMTLGKVSLDEFAMGASNQTSYFGPVVNPWDRGDGKKLVPGGSSGGSAAAVAAHAVLGATGSCTAGSVRQPAALCGIVGVKPTYGRASRYGMVAFASSLDQAGVMTRNVADAALMLQHICSYDPKDATSVNVPTPDWTKNLNQSIKGMKIGVPQEAFIDGMNLELRAEWERRIEDLKKSGAEIVSISLPHFKYSVPIYYIIAPAEASSNLARYDGVRYSHRTANPENIIELYEKSRAEGFGREVQRRMMLGAFVLSSSHFDAYFTQAQKIRRLLVDELDAAFKSVDVIFKPTAPGPAFGIGEKFGNPIDLYLEDLYTVPANHAGLPAISVPTGLFKNGLPIGLQFMAKRFDEASMFKAASALEQIVDFKHKPQFTV